MKKIYFLMGMVLWSAGLWAQVSLTNGTPTALIDFSNTTPTGVGSNPSTAYAGAGFEPATVTAGRLNSNAWAVTGWSNGVLAFGGTQNTATTDYTRGATAAAVTTGGFYAYTGAPGSAANPAFMIQPGSSDWAPGTLTLRIQNNGTTNITQLAVDYNIFVRNDQGRSNTFNFSYSSDDVTYTPVGALDYASTAALDALGWVIVGTAPSRSTLITGLTITPGSYVYIRWSGADNGGSGSRDEFGLDDINLTATYSGGATPDIVLSSANPSVPAGNIAQGTNNNVIYNFELAVTTADAVLNGVTINTLGTYTAADITNFKCWYSADAVFNAGTDVLLSTLAPVAVAGPQVFPAFVNQLIANGATGYMFITADLPCTSTITNDISVDAITTADISFVDGNKSGTASAGGQQTIIVATPNNVTAPAASVANASSNLTWVNPAGCYDEVLIVARATVANDGVPTGDGSTYVADPIFGNGTPLGNGFVVYKGFVSGQPVTNLVNGTEYFYKFFTRLGTTWSAGVEVSATPAVVTLPTDYFRSVASGDWATLATWESSNDSIGWIPATLIPGALAAHVTIRNPDSVWLSIATTTINLTLESGAIMNAQANIMLATNRFNLLGTSSFYQGGTVTLVPGVEQVLESTSNYHYNGTQNGTTLSYPEFGNLFWETTPASGGTLQNTNGLPPFNFGMVVRGDMTINIQGATPREIRFATGSTVSRTHTIDGNLNIIGANSIAVVQNGSATSTTTGTVNIGGNLNISAGGIFQALSTSAASGGNAIVNLNGDINNTGGTMQSGASTIGFDSLNFVSVNPQNINSTGGTFTFTNRQTITINNSAGVTLNTPITVLGKIDFVEGIVSTTAVNLLTMAAGSTVAGANNLSFVNGPVKKVGNTAFTFPVGKVNGYVPIRISNFVGGTATDEFTAEYIRASADALGGVTAPLIDHVSYCEYWTLDLNNGTPAVDVTLFWTANNTCGGGAYITNLAELEIAHFDGVNWDASSFGFSATNGTAFVGDITWTGVTAFSPFALASRTLGDNPLPITINYFNGAKQNGNHLLNWKVTCFNTPNATISLERSTDGRNYSSIYSLVATAVRCQQPFDYTDMAPAKGTNYYRLKMTDADGKVTYSSIVHLINAVKGMDILNIAPNPIMNGNFNLKVSAAEKAQMELLITDMQGRVLQKINASLIAGFNSIPVNVRNLAAGTYQLYGNTADGRTRVLRFVIQ